MTQPGPTALVILDSPAVWVETTRLLAAELSRYHQAGGGGVVTGGHNPLIAITPSDPLPEVCPDIVFLDWASYQARRQDLQTTWAKMNAALVLLLAEGDTAPANLFDTNIDDYLYASDLPGPRVGLIIRRLGQQRQLQRQLEDCSQLQSFFNQPGVGINQADEAGRFLRVNRRFCDLLGYSEAELLQLSYQQVTHSDDLIRQAELEHQLFVGANQGTTFEKRYIKKDGGIVWTRVTLSPVLNGTQRPVSDVALVEDISDRVHMAQELQKSQALLTDILNNTQACIASFRLFPDFSWQYDYYSPGCEKIYGYSADKLREDPGLWQSRVVAEDFETVIGPTIQAVFEGQTTSTIEYRFRHYDGSIRWISESFMARWQGQQQCWIITTVGVDVSDRKQAEVALQENRDFLQTMVNHLPVSLFVKDVRAEHFGQIVMVNPACEHLLGCSQDALLNRTVHDLFPQAQANEFDATERQIMASGNKAELEETLDHPLLGQRTLKTIKVPIYGSDQQPRYLLGICQDVTAQKQAEAALKLSQARLLEAQRLARLGDWDYDLTTGKITWSPEIFRQFGWDESDQAPTFDELMTLVHPEDRPTFQQATEALIAEGTPYGINHRILRADGTIAHVFWRGEAIFNDQNQVIKLFGISQDITETQTIALALQANERKYRALISALPDLIIRMTGDGFYLDFFAASNIKVLGDPTDLIGVSVYDLGLSYELAEQRMGYIRRAIDTGQLQIYRQEIFNGEADVTEEVRIVRSGDNEVLIIVRDITEAAQLEVERQQSKMALEASEERLRFALEAAQMGSWDWNIVTNHIIWSESLERLMGMVPGTFDGRLETITAMIYPEDRQQVAEAVNQALAQDSPYEIEFRFVKPDGGIRWALSKGQVLRDGDGRPIRMAGMDIDITDRKQVLLDLQRTTEELDRFFSVALDLLCIASTEGYFLRLNPAWEKTLGYASEELMGSKFLDYVHADDLDSTLTAMGQLSEQQEVINFVNRYRHRDGSYRWIEWRSIPVGDLVYAAARDITDRKLAETQLEHQNALLAQIARGESLGTILAALVNEIEQQLPGALCSILLLDADSCLRHGASQKLPEAYVKLVDGVKMGHGVGSCGTAAWRNETVIVSDIAQHPFWQDYKEVALRFDLRACWSFPIVGSSGKVLGVFGTYYQMMRSPQSEELHTIGQIANLAGIAIERQQSESAIKASEARFRQIADTVREGFFIAGADALSYIYLNPAYASILGFSEEALYDDGRHWFENIHPGDQDRIAVGLSQELQGQIFDAEYRFVRPDGEIRWLRSQGFPVPDDSGMITQVVGILEDITDRKRVEIALRESERRYATLTEYSPVGVYQADLDGQVIYVNPMWCQLSGLNPEEVMGPNWVQALHPDDRDEVVTAWHRAIQQESYFTRECRFQHPDGQVRWIYSQAIPLMDDGGNAVGYMGTVTDITGRKQAEAQIQEITQRLTLATDAAQIAIWDFDVVADRMIWDERMYDLYGLDSAADEVTFQTWQQSILPEDLAAVEAQIQAALTGEMNFHPTFRIVLPTGDVRFIEAHGVVSRNHEGMALRMIGVNWDISDRKRAELELQQSEARYRAIVEDQTELVARLQPNGVLVFVNEAFCRYYGIPKEVALGQRYQSWVYPEDQPVIDQCLAELSPEQPVGVVEHRVIVKHTVRWTQWVNRAIYDPQGYLIEIQVVGRDIEARKQALVALQALNEELEQRVQQRTEDLTRSEQDLRTIFNNVYDAVFVLDQNGIVIDVNDRALELSGATRNQLTGMPIADLSAPDLSLEFTPERLQRAQTGEILCFEWKNRRFDDYTSFDTEVTLRQVKLGDYQLLLAGLRDISDRKQAEHDLQAERIRLELALDAASMGTWSCMLSTGLLTWSAKAQQIFGFAPGAFPGDRDTFVAMIHPEDRDRVLQAIAHTFETGDRYNIEYRIRRLDGKTRWIAVWGIIPPGIEATERQLIGVVADVTDRKQAETALYESEERLRLALMASNQGLYDFDLLNGEAVVSPGYVTMLGYNPANFRETHIKWLQRLHPEDRQRVGETFRAYIAGEIPNYKVECRQRMQDGSYKWILSVGKMVAWDHAGNPLRMIGTQTDINDRKQAEAALQESEDRFRQIAENINEVFWLSTPDHQILYASPAYEQIWGQPATNLSAKKWLETIHPNDRDRLLSREDASFNPYSTHLLGANAEIEYRIVRPDGDIRWIRDRAFPIYDDQGEIQRIAGVAEDITERKRLEQEQQRLLTILEASPDHIGIAAPDGTLIWTNRQAKQLRGLPLDVDVSQIALEIFHPQWAQEVIKQEAIPMALQQGIWVGETALLNASGEEIPVSQLVWAHRSATNEVEYLSTIMRDISDLKQAERALREANAELENRVAERTAELLEAKDSAESANQAKSIFLANMSHELRTPLNAILGFSQLMGRDPALSKQHLEELKIINRSGEHLLTLINDILEMSKIEAGQIILNLTKFNLPQLLTNLVDMLRLKADSKGLSFNLNLHSDVPQYVCTDSHKLRQVLLNLLSNAIKFTQSGYIVLRVEPGNLATLESATIAFSDAEALSLTALRFEVEDSGIGIASEEMDLLFEPFMQTSSGRLSQEGTGLGLPISHQFVQLMGGDLVVSSQPQIGSTFAFEIPVQVVNGSALEPMATIRRAVAIAPDHPPYRILVVEDNWANRVLLQNLLLAIGFEVQTADNGQTAVEQWQNWQPHLIFMDIRMPILNGCEATQEIRRRQQTRLNSQPSPPPTKIISLTAGVLHENQSVFANIGFDDFLNKPIQEVAITQTIAQHLGVVYIYETELDQLEASTAAARVYPTAESLQKLPTDWLGQFHHALRQLDQDRMLALIADLSSEYAGISQTLSCRVRDFDYELLLNLIGPILKHS